MTTIPRTGTPKRAIYAAFKTGGVDAAIAEAVDRGFKESSARVWSARWAKESDAPTISTSRKEPEIQVMTNDMRRRSEGLPICTLRRSMFDAKSDTPHTAGRPLCVVIKRGDERSIIRWLSSGYERTVPTQRILRVEGLDEAAPSDTEQTPEVSGDASAPEPDRRALNRR